MSGARLRSLLAVVCAIALAGPGCTGTTGGNTIKLGVDLPLSGIDGASAIPARNAILLAIEEANARGLPRGARIVLDDLDDAIQGKHDPAQGAQNVRVFAADPAVIAVVGPMNSNVAEAEIPLANAAHLALLSMAATAVGLTQGSEAKRLLDAPTFFRVCATDDRQGEALAHFALGMHRARTFIIDDNESYGRGLADVFASAYARTGGTLVGREHLTSFGIDYEPLLTKVRSARPDAVFFGGIVSTGGAVLRKQMGDTGLGALPYFGGDGLASPEYQPLAGRFADGTYFTLVAPDVFTLPAARTFVAAYRARFHADPGNYSAGAYAAAEVALAAIASELRHDPGAMPSREGVVRGIAGTANLASPVGPIAFDPSGDLRAPIVSLYRFENGTARFVEQAEIPKPSMRVKM